MKKFKVMISMNMEIEIPESELNIDSDIDDAEDFLEAAEEAAPDFAEEFANNLTSVLRNVTAVEVESSELEGSEGTLDMLDD